MCMLYIYTHTHTNVYIYIYVRTYVKYYYYTIYIHYILMCHVNITRATCAQCSKVCKDQSMYRTMLGCTEPPLRNRQLCPASLAH